MTDSYLLMSTRTNMPMGVYSTMDKAIQAGSSSNLNLPAWCVAVFNTDGVPKTDDMISIVYRADEFIDGY